MPMARPEGGLLRVRVLPRARRTEVDEWQGAALRVRVQAPPADGAANRAVTALLAETFGVPPSAVRLVSGARGRDKLFRIGDLAVDDLRARLRASRR